MMAQSVFLGAFLISGCVSMALFLIAKLMDNQRKSANYNDGIDPSKGMVGIVLRDSKRKGRNRLTWFVASFFAGVSVFSLFFVFLLYFV